MSYTQSNARAALELTGRLLLASLFVVAALQKIQGYQDVAGWMTSMGVPGDLLPFVPELGPPSSGYAITWPDSAGRRQEPSDRWAEMLRLKRIAENLSLEVAGDPPGPRDVPDVPSAQ